MACNRHKRREGGDVVPILRGIAEDANRIVGTLHDVTICFGIVRKYRGKPKVRVRWGANAADHRVVRLEICDPEHGEGVFRIRTLHPAAVARALHKGLKRDRRLAAYKE